MIAGHGARRSTASDWRCRGLRGEGEGPPNWGDGVVRARYRLDMRAARRSSMFTATVIVLAGACGGSGDGEGPGFDLGGGGDIEVGAGEDVLPSDFYLPDDIVPGLATSNDATISFTGTMNSGTIDEIEADMVAGLLDAGYELLSNDEIPVFARNGVGRVRVRVSEFLDSTTVNVDIDRWTDEQLDEMRALLADPVMVPAQAVADVDGVTYTATGECRLQGDNRMFSSGDGSLTVQIDETQDPPRTYADVTTPDGIVYSTEFEADLDYSGSDDELVLSGDMVLYNDEAAGPVSFTATATCG